MQKHDILIVSADQDFIHICRQALPLFVNVLTASSGAEGLERFASQQPYCVVFIDFKLPDMTGVAFFKRIKNVSECATVLTAAHEDVLDALEWANKNHIFRLMPKPCNKDSLSTVLQDALAYYMIIERKKQVEDKLLFVSITDPLTGCFNRAYLNDRIPEEMNKSYRYNRNLSIVLCDIDDIRSINRNYGNWAGDKVLINFVQCAKDTIRKKIDLVYRLNNNKFLIVLPETSMENAVHVAERLRSTSSNKTFSSDTKQIHFTVSFGVSSYNLDNYETIQSPDDLLELAERSLRKAKGSGGNVVISC